MKPAVSVGGGGLETVTVWVELAVCPEASVTVRTTVKLAAAWYVWVTELPEPVPESPNVQEYV